MAILTKTIIINAPAEKVFAYAIEPTNLPEIWPSMIEVKDVQPSPAGGYNYGWVYKMAGMRIEGASETTECIPNKRTVTKSIKGIQSTFTWTYQPDAGGTKLTVEVEYTIPVPLLGKLVETFIVKLNEHEAEVMLANLKARIEI
jgi:uncharacterized membrane protein